MKITLSLLPVLLFLFSLFVLDRFKLVKPKTLIACLLWGLLAAVLAYAANTWLINQFNLEFAFVSRYVAPLTEEALKVLVIIFLIIRQKAGFVIDAAVYGFAAGAGFSLMENIFYLYNFGSHNEMIYWIIRGLGTALMHGGCTGLFAMVIMHAVQRDKPVLISLPTGLLVASLLHSGYNHFFLHPILQTILVFTMIPAVFVIVFQISNFRMQRWLEIEFSNEVELLRMIRQGKFLATKAGNYLVLLKQYFSPELILDLYCYISLYMELSIKAKRNLLLQENGYPAIEETDMVDKLTELKQLCKRIGKIGELALQPLIRMNHRELWKLNQLKSK
jgi:protease PrsW